MRRAAKSGFGRGGPNSTAPASLLPAATLLRLGRLVKLLPSQPEARGGPEADIIQSREGAAHGTAPGARLTNREKELADRVGKRLPIALVGPLQALDTQPGEEAPATRRVPGAELSWFHWTSCHPPDPRALHPESSGTGRGSAVWQSLPSESSALSRRCSGLAWLAVWAGKKGPPRCSIAL